MIEDADSREPVHVLVPGRQCLLVRLTAKEGMRPALLDSLNSYADGLSEEPGTEVYMVSLDPDNENLVWLYELFHGEEAEQAHRESQGFATLLGQLNDLLDGPPALLRMSPLRMTVQPGVLTEDWQL